ncbi:energy-coupling factor transporter transmembrane component T family protein [uncultured Microbacterium sp.]|uniref:energy-coupling factor transporter transmembrane component T family protein n=1 Tax=uncultured Microbacterium sp. TaxID=191216 RepID=UPI00261628EE|nr:energy-coupling factor transporter transmembrane protein EcfT [uncultured Microbacterium sp.]
MIPLYRPGNGMLHRLPAAAKLCALVVVSLVISIWAGTVVAAVGALLAVIAVHLIAGLGLREVLRSIWQLRWLILVLGTFLWVFSGAEAAVVAVARMASILLAAAAVTASTPMGEMLDVLRVALAPLRRFGVNADAVSLTLLLVIAMVPVIAGFRAQMRDAERARGVRLGWRMVLPLLVRALRHGDQVAEALTARGLA